MKLSQQERAVFGICPVCQAANGQPCIVAMIPGDDGPVDFGAHRRRLQLAPTEVPGQDQGDGTMPDHYLKALERVKACGPDWPAEVRLDLIMATAMMMQAGFNAGLPYGAAGLPNMQTLIEIGGMPAAELEGLRDMMAMQIDSVLVPFFREGKLPGEAGAVSEVQQIVQGAGASLNETLVGIREAVKAGNATEGEKRLIELLEEGMEIGKDMLRDLLPLVLGIDEKRWPGAAEVKAAVIFGAQHAGVELPPH